MALYKSKNNNGVYAKHCRLEKVWQPQRAREQRGARLVNDDTALWWPARARTQKVAASFRAGSFGVLHNADEFSH